MLTADLSAYFLRPYTYDECIQIARDDFGWSYDVIFVVCIHSKEFAPVAQFRPEDSEACVIDKRRYWITNNPAFSGMAANQVMRGKPLYACDDLPF